MGCSVHIELPLDVQGNEISEAIAAIAGLRADLVDMNANEPYREGIAWRIDHDVEVRPTSIFGMGDINLGNTVPMTPGIYRSGYLHLCYRDDDDPARMNNLISATSNPLWCAIGRRLVQFFGGRVTFNDCGSGRRNIYRHERSCPVDDDGLIPHDGEQWNAYHVAASRLRPITERDMEVAGRVAAYERQVAEPVEAFLTAPEA